MTRIRSVRSSCLSRQSVTQMGGVAMDTGTFPCQKIYTTSLKPTAIIIIIPGKSQETHLISAADSLLSVYFTNIYTYICAPHLQTQI